MVHSRARSPLMVALALILAAIGFFALQFLMRDGAGDVPRLVAAGLSAHKRGDYKQAVALFDRALAVDPAHLPALHARAAARYGVDELEPAIIDYERIIELAPDDVEARFRLAKALLGVRREKEMFEEIDALLQMTPNHGEARLLRARVRLNRGEYQHSLRNLDLLVSDEAMRGGAPLAEILPLRAEARMSVGDDHGALADLERLRELGADAADIDRATVWALWGLGRYDDALFLLDESIKRSPASRILQFARALTLTCLGRFEAAAECLEQLGAGSAAGAPPESVFFLLIASARIGHIAPEPLDPPHTEAMTPWQLEIAQFLADPAGAPSEADFLRHAAEWGGGAECEGFFYAGMKRLLAGDEGEARDLLQRCIETNRRRLYEYHAAVAELRRLENGVDATREPPAPPGANGADVRATLKRGRPRVFRFAERAPPCAPSCPAAGRPSPIVRRVGPAPGRWPVPAPPTDPALFAA